MPGRVGGEDFWGEDIVGEISRKRGGESNDVVGTREGGVGSSEDAALKGGATRFVAGLKLGRDLRWRVLRGFEKEVRRSEGERRGRRYGRWR